SDTIKLDGGAIEFTGKESSRFAPASAVVLSRKNCIPREQEPVFLITEIDVVDGLGRAHNLPHPGPSTVIGPAQEAVIATDPAALRIEKVNGIEVALRRPHTGNDPSRLP